jgi:hypothetical protein
MERGSTPSLVQRVGSHRRASVVLWCIAAVLALLLFAPPLQAQAITIDSWVDEDSPVELTWSEVVADNESPADGHHRYADIVLVGDDRSAAPSRPAIARYGPFYVIDSQTVEMIGTVHSDTPAAFAAMVRAYPGLQQLVMVECPGSVDEAANLSLARAVRRAGLATHVPAHGSVRSGAVELWLAGVQRSAAEGAEFGVHSWRDEDGREASDFAPGDRVHAEYLGYYREMGMDDGIARRFYALTNSVGFDDLRILSRRDLAALGLLAAAADAG